MQVGAVLVGLKDGAQLAKRATGSLLQRNLDGVLGRTVLQKRNSEPIRQCVSPIRCKRDSTLYCTQSVKIMGDEYSRHELSVGNGIILCASTKWKP